MRTPKERLWTDVKTPTVQLKHQNKLRRNSGESGKLRQNKVETEDQNWRRTRLRLHQINIKLKRQIIKERCRINPNKSASSADSIHLFFCYVLFVLLLLLSDSQLRRNIWNLNSSACSHFLRVKHLRSWSWSWPSDPLILTLWSPDPLTLWSPDPLIPWSPDPLIPWPWSWPWSSEAHIWNNTEIKLPLYGGLNLPKSKINKNKRYFWLNKVHMMINVTKIK